MNIDATTTIRHTHTLYTQHVLTVSAYRHILRVKYTYIDYYYYYDVTLPVARTMTTKCVSASLSKRIPLHWARHAPSYVKPPPRAHVAAVRHRRRCRFLHPPLTTSWSIVTRMKNSTRLPFYTHIHTHTHSYIEGI